MNMAISDVMQFVQENDVKFIRLAFCDIFGTQKNIAIPPDQLLRAFHTGISFDASAVRGFLDTAQSDLFLVPDPAALSVLPWRPAHGRVVRLFCNIRYPDGRPFEGDVRYLLRKAADRATNQGWSFQVGPECEFYLFLTDEKGFPTLEPHDRAGYCDVAPYDRGENVRREICLSLEEMGVIPESSHHEQGPGQNEIDFAKDSPLAAADNLMAFRSAVKAAAANNGLYASFLPKPLEKESGSGLHINLSLYKEGCNLFEGFGHMPAPQAKSFTQGILRRAAEISAFLNPLANSYCRLGEWEAPRYISWSCQNRSQLVRVPAAAGEYSRIEVRQADPACNPYLAVLLLLEAGLEGLEEKLELEPATDENLYRAAAGKPDMAKLPENLGEALEQAHKSSFLKRVLPAPLLERYLAKKDMEWEWECTHVGQPYSYSSLVKRYLDRI